MMEKFSKEALLLVLDEFSSNERRIHLISLIEQNGILPAIMFGEIANEKHSIDWYFDSSWLWTFCLPHIDGSSDCAFYFLQKVLTVDPFNILALSGALDFYNDPESTLTFEQANVYAERLRKLDPENKRLRRWKK